MERFGSGRHLSIGLSMKCDILCVRYMPSAGMCHVTCFVLLKYIFTS